MARDVVVMGASAGGVDALRQVVSGFPADWSAAVMVVVHVPPDAECHLPEILARAGPLPARQPQDGEPLSHGTIYVAPPDHHLVILDGHVGVTKGPRQNRNRPSIDTLFRSAAYSHGPRVTGVVLTGALGDGSAGLASIRARGGVTVVQDPEEATFSGMPRSALRLVDVDYCVRLSDMAPLLRELVADKDVPAEVREASKDLEMEIRSDQGDLSMDETLEDSLWAAARSMMENAHCKERVAARLLANGHEPLARRLRMEAEETRRRAETIRKVVNAESRG